MNKFVFDSGGETFLEEMNESSFAKVLNAVLVSAEGGDITRYSIVFFHSKLVQFPLVIFPFIGIAEDVKD